MGALRLNGAVALVFVLALAACTAPTNSPTPPGASPTASVVLPPGSGGLPTGPPAPGAVWRHLGDFPAEAATNLSSVAATADGFIAVGHQPWPGEDADGHQLGVVWRSADGLTWQRETPQVLGQAMLDHVVSLGDSIYIFGSWSTCPLFDEGDCEDDPNAGKAVWRAAGGDWEMLPPSLELADMDPIYDVVVAGDRMVVFGDSGEEIRTVVWTSSDGIRWSASDTAGIDPIESMAGGPAGVVAFGTIYDAITDEVSLAAAWSADGLHFERVNVPAGLDVSIDSIAYGDAGWMAVGSSYPDGIEPAPLVFASTDGRAWSDQSAQAGLSGVGFDSVTAVPGGFVGVAFQYVDEESDLVLALPVQSRDGTAWQAMGDMAGAVYTSFGAAALSGPGLVVFLATDDGDIGSGQVSGWFAPLNAVSIR